MRLKSLALSLTMLIALSWRAVAWAQQSATSPDGNVNIEFVLQNGGVPAYKIDYLGQPIVLESRLGLGTTYTSGFSLAGTSSSAHAGQWINDFGEKRIVPDNYTELNVDLAHASGAQIRLTFRAYDEGAALRYSFPVQTQQVFTYSGERTEFRFPANTFGWEEHGTEGIYQRRNTASIQAFTERPLTLEYASGAYAALAEAGTTNYPRMLLSPLSGVTGALVSALGGTSSNGTTGGGNNPNVTLAAGSSTPWRMFVVGQRPGDLLERNYLMLNLNEPSALDDTSWIKPGKAMRDTQLTTANSKAIIDLAATAGLQYVHLDANWYQSGNPSLPRTGLDVQGIVDYGDQKGVGVILYVDRNDVKAQRDVIFPLYEQWGVKGVKLGFVSVGPQTETAWITETIERAAEHRLMLNIHDGYRATGNVRTLPNLMTVEGIRGNEQFPTPSQNAVLPFTRYVGGPGDYTVCYYDSRIKGTHAHQLAMAVVSFSPLQWLYWYDTPSRFHNEPELEFFRQVPTVWDDTKVLNGAIGDYATIARQSGDQWFLGTINGSVSRQLQIPLDFLTDGVNYVARIYFDDSSVPTATHVGIQTLVVDSQTILNSLLMVGGGQAIWILPVIEGDFNADLTVDGTDLTIWRSHFGAASGATFSMGDNDSDGDVDGDDFLAWQRQLGAGSPLAAFQATPEPSGFLLALACAVAAPPLAKARRRRPLSALATTYIVTSKMSDNRPTPMPSVARGETGRIYFGQATV